MNEKLRNLRVYEIFSPFYYILGFLRILMNQLFLKPVIYRKIFAYKETSKKKADLIGSTSFESSY